MLQTGHNLLHVCTQLFLTWCPRWANVCRYQNKPTEALSCFNHARKDSEWGEKALFNMIKICLNPGNETLGGETFKPLEADTG